MVKIIYDSVITGHHSEYLGHLVKYIVDQNSDVKYYFVVPEELKIRFPEIFEQSLDSSTIFWKFIPAEKITFIRSLSLFQRSFTELALVQEYANKLQATEVILMYFNIFQLALCLKKPKFAVTGILFLQFYRMNRKSILEKLKYYRKYLTTSWYVRNPSLKRVFILNDKKTADFLNLEFNTEKFKMLEDPIPELTPISNFNIFEYFKIDNHREIYLHIGALDERKGTFEILESLKYLSEKRQKKVCILLVGKSGSVETENKIVELMNNAQEKTGAQILRVNRFVSNDLMKSLFDHCNVVLMPYKNTEASSGILGHAMASNKIIITTGSGLLKEIVQEYNFGILLDRVNPKEIAQVIENVGSSKKDGSDSIKVFLKKHSPKNFANKILFN